jgi:glycogen phosphorylase
MSNKEKAVAYFCMEYGLSSSFKIYSGGLGILAGDMLKGAKDCNKPVVGIGLLWKQGYTEQKIGSDLRPYDCYPDFNYDFLEDTGVKVKVKIRLNEVTCKVWKVTAFGNATLYLLDTYVDENADRLITGQLYGWFGEERIAQEMVLGIGGVRALRALNIPIDVYHFNEGHALLAGIELLREKMDKGEGFDQALAKTKKEIVFTTHTPVKAGNEHHQHEVLQYMGANQGLSIDQMHRLGGTPFNMTVAALRMSRKSNAVAQLHGVVANEMWSDVDQRSEIIAITNGVHNGTWVAESFSKPSLTDDEIWKSHQQLKAEVIAMVKDRSGVALDPDVLLIGFSRRAAPYKRSDLLFADIERARKLFSDRKIQIVFSGKAHPQDDGGKRIIAKIVQFSKEFPQHVVFLENYDMVIGAALTRGSDIWLNNPRRPLEACGTSGMKAAMNGVLNVSTLDGWWDEACEDGVNGWSIGNRDKFASDEAHDAHDAKALYEVIEKKVVPTFYNDRAKWLTMMRASIDSCKERFSATRMVEDYYKFLY